MLTFLPSCDKEDVMEEDCEATGITCDNHVGSFLASNCTNSGCHDSNADVSVGDYTTYATATNVFIQGGRLLGAINHESGFSNMPKGESKLDSCSIAKLTNWVNAGYPEN